MTTCERLLPNACALTVSPCLTLFAEVFPVRTLASPEKAPDLAASVPACGGNTTASLPNAARRGSSPKTSLPFAVEDWMKFSGRSLRSGMMRSGIVFPLEPLAPLTAATECGSWPTPNAGGGTGYMSGSKRDTWRPTLAGAVNMAPSGPPPIITADEFRGLGRKAAMKLWTTPLADDTGHRKASFAQGGTALSTQVGGALNPPWVEWLMGYPAEWTALDALATPLSRKSRK